MNLIFIHGRAQGGKDPENLRNTWLDTLKLGLGKSKLDIPISEENIFFPYYGDLLDSLVAQFKKSIKNNIIQKGNGLPINQEQLSFFHDFLQNIADNANITEEDIKTEYTSEFTEKSSLTWKWIFAILKAIDKKGSWSLAVIKTFTRDVFLYLTNPHVKNTMNNEVKKVFTNDPCVVVGHSLGSIIAYNILRDSPNLKVTKFITLGSPLGITAVKNHLKVPIQMPDCVYTKEWFNAYDKRDVVALKPLNEQNFNIAPYTIVNKDDVNNQTPNRHGIEGYLDDEIVAKTIYDALNHTK
ncbi:MAG: hypothetical protein MUC49_21340 [Raineya sp.]|jgi:hypothetical protein|nr:hypothetical protein [Raineya sp.]